MNSGALQPAAAQRFRPLPADADPSLPARHPGTQVKLYLFAYVIVVTMIVRSADPFGWRGLITLTVAQLMLDLGSSALYSIL